MPGKPIASKPPIAFVGRLSLKSKFVFSLIFVLAVTFLAFSPCLKNGFVNWDDDQHLLDNITVRSLSFDNLKEVFTNTVNKTYIPLTTLSFAFEYHFVGNRPYLYHLDNVVLHMGVTALVFIFAWRMRISLVAAAMAALLFGIHPMHVESVAWVTERKDVLYSLFYMLAACSYWEYLTGRKKWAYLLVVIFGLLSILAKPMALSLPLVLFLLDWLHKRKWSALVLLDKLPIFLFIVPITWITYALNARVPVSNIYEAPLIWLWTLTFYLEKFIWPLVLVPLYPLPRPVSLSNPAFLVSCLFFVFMLWSLWKLRKDRGYIFAFVFFFFSIFFLLRFDDIVDKTIVSDRFMYLPSVGFCFWAGLWLEGVFARFDKKNVVIRKTVIAGISLLFIVFGVKTFLQCGIWQNSISLWEYQLGHYPNTKIALNNLATAYSFEDDYIRAVTRFQKDSWNKQAPAEIPPEDKRAIDRIITLYQKTVVLDPKYTDALYNLGNTYKEIGRLNDALTLYSKTIEIDPHYTDAYFDMATVYVLMKKPQEAVAAYRKSVESNPDSEDVYMAVIKACHEEAGKYDSAAALFKKAEEETFALLRNLVFAKKYLSVTYFNFGVLCGEVGRYQEAVEAYQKSLTINPRNAKVFYNLGNAYMALGEGKEAIVAYQKTIEINPRHVDAHINLSIAYSRERNFKEALKYCLSAEALGYQPLPEYLATLKTFQNDN